MASHTSQEEMTLLKTSDVESDSALEETAPVRRFRTPTKVVLAAALLGVVALAAVGVQMNADRSTSDTETDAWDLQAITELNDADASMKDMDPKVKVIMGFFGAWGKNKFEGKDCKDNAANFLDKDLTMNGLGISKKLWGRQLKGVAEFCDLMDHMSKVPFKMTDFKFAYPPYVSGNKVIIIPRYLPKNKESGDVSEHTEYDAQIWHIKDGKAIHADFIQAYPKMMNDAVDDKTPPPNDDIKAVEAMMAAWGNGKYHGKECMEEAKKQFATDVSIDAYAPMKNTDGYKKYSGIQGLCDWCKFLETAPLLNFKIDGVQSKGPGKVGVGMQSQVPLANGKNSSAIHSFMLVNVKDHKVESMEFALGGLKVIDDFFERQKKL